jgi:hypothetical protein
MKKAIKIRHDFLGPIQDRLELSLLPNENGQFDFEGDEQGSLVRARVGITIAFGTLVCGHSDLQDGSTLAFEQQNCFKVTPIGDDYEEMLKRFQAFDAKKVAKISTRLLQAFQL